MEMLVALFQKIGEDLLAQCHKHIVEYARRNLSEEKVAELDFIDYEEWRDFAWSYSRKIGITNRELYKILLPSIADTVRKTLNKSLDLENFDYMSEQV